MTATDETVQFLADESCDFAVVRALREHGWEVLAVAELAQSADDRTVISLAVTDARILLTEDKDFGQLVFAANCESGGVILIRYPSSQRSELGATVVRVVRETGARLRKAFVVIQPGRVRITRVPRATH